MPLLLQVDPAPFWPTTADSWFSLAGVVFTVVVTVGSLLWRQARIQAKLEDRIATLEGHVKEKFEEQGKRIGKAETNCAGHGASIEELRRTDMQHALQLDTNTREVTRAQTEIDSIDKSFSQHLREAGQVETRLRERMARIEERLKLPANKERDNG